MGHDADINRMAFRLRRAVEEMEGGIRHNPSWKVRDSEANTKALQKAAELALKLQVDAQDYVAHAYTWVGGQQLYLNALASPKLEAYIVDMESLSEGDYNARLRELGYDIPDDAQPYTSAEYDLIIAVQYFDEWLSLVSGGRGFTDEVIDKYLTKEHYQQDPLVIYICGSYNPRVRQLFRDQAQQLVDEDRRTKEALIRLGWKPAGLNI